MISKAEIESKATEFQIHASDVQRDYIFGWILSSLFSVSEFKDKIFLKGGNALRKGYFENTRFSPDLDFGTPGEIAQEDVVAGFSKVCSRIQEQTGVIFLPDAFRISEWYPKNVVTDLKVYDLRLYFQDFYGHSDHIKIRVSIDLARYDRTLLPLQTRQLIHPYSDSSAAACELRCMKLEEIIATKLKCLLQRQHAPDLFDYVYSIKLLGGRLDRIELVKTFIRKTIFGKNPQFVKDLLLNSPLTFFRNVWQSSIICAKQAAIEVDEAIAIFQKDLKDLFAPIAGGSYSSFEFFGPHLRNPIMEAGRNQTCLEVTYDSKRRLVEPYSLKYMQRKDGIEREYLYVYDLDGGKSGPGPKSFVASKLTAVANTEIKFKPRWPVELSKAGEIPDDHYFFDPNRPAKSPNTHTRSSGGIEYSYKCPYCGKLFRRNTMTASLNFHKNKSGYDCPGRYGIYVSSTLKS